MKYIIVESLSPLREDSLAYYAKLGYKLVSVVYIDKPKFHTCIFTTKGIFYTYFSKFVD